MHKEFLPGLAGLLAFVLAGVPVAAEAKCNAGAIGMSREVEIDPQGAPRFGQLQYPGPDFLKPGEIVLTFDDGPHKQLTPTILDTLDAHCVKATFFMVGQRAMMYPDLVREVARRGHTVATHTWSHRNLKQISSDSGVSEIELGISGVQRALGKPAAPFFRFPYLSDPGYAIQHLRQRNTAIFSIDVDSYDFRTRSPTVVMRNVTRQLKSKRRGIILFHDIQPSTAGALGALLSDLAGDGYKVVHLRTRAQQTTIAAYDKRVGTPKSGGPASSALEVSRRAAVNPAWEPRVAPQRQAQPVSQPPQVASPPPEPARTASTERPRPRSGDDWRITVFRGY